MSTVIFDGRPARRRMRHRPRARMIAAAVLSLGLASIGVVPASAVPASVPSVNYRLGDSTFRSATTYGAPAPSPKALIIGATTRLLYLVVDFPQLDVLTCTMTGAQGSVLATSTNLPDPDLQGNYIAELDIPAGIVTTGSGANYLVDCNGPYVTPQASGVVAARFILTEGAGAGVTARFGEPVKFGGPTTRTAHASMTQYVPTPGAHPTVLGSGQTVVPGSRVRIYTDWATFWQQSATNKLAVSVTSRTTTVSALDVSATPDGKILGFTVPSGLPAGRVDFALKAVATNGSYNFVTRWTDYATYDPNADGKSLTLTPYPTIAWALPIPDQVLTVQAGNWQPAPVTLRYVWKRDGVAISGATSASYRLTNADVGHKLTVAVTGSKSTFRSATRESPSTALIVPN